MPDAVIVATARTPMGRYGGQLKDVRPDDLAAIALKAVCERIGLDLATLQKDTAQHLTERAIGP